MAIHDDDAAIDGLVAAGQHAEAAKRASEAGRFARAAELYEKLWDFRGALVAARAGGDRVRALRYALEVHDEPATRELVAELSATEDGAREALAVLVRMRRHADAAPLAERLGDSDQAIELYARAHRELEAARLLEAAGRDRDAGRMLERALDLAAEGERAPIELALGRILARRGAYPEAARLLQDARKHAPLRAEAQRHLIATLAAMGLRDGARDALLELRHADPDVPADLDSYLRQWRDQAAERKVTRDRELIANRYRLDRLLGAGASGRVFLATDEIAGRTVALKMFFATPGGPAYERFVREARLASTLRHPSLVEVYDVSVERGFLVMEYLAGGSLAQRLAGGQRLAAAQVRRMALDLASGLEAAHHRGVVHRDVKPANIFFDARGTAKLGDFGVAHLVDLGQTQTGGLIGTLAYMSPEQITGAAISIAADLYALGVTLFEALTGRLPFLGPDFVAQHLGDTAPAPSTITPHRPSAALRDPAEPDLSTITPHRPSAALRDPAEPDLSTITPHRPSAALRDPAEPDLSTITPHRPSAALRDPAEPDLSTITPHRPSAALRDPAEPDLSAVADIEPGWDAVIAGLLVKNPRDRTASLAELRRQLEALELGGPRVVLPRAKRGTGPHSIAALAAEGEAQPRYQFETSLGATPISQLARAVDTVLDRSVVIERFDGSEDAERALEHARLLGRVQSPFVQRALGLDRAARTVVFEAPAGAPIADVHPELPPAEAVRLLKRLARAAAAIHELGGSHGAIGTRTIVLDEVVPTLLAAGLGPVAPSTPHGDVDAILGLVAAMVGCEPSLAALATTLCQQVGARVPALTAVEDGEALYAAADAIDIAVLGALGAR